MKTFYIVKNYAHNGFKIEQAKGIPLPNQHTPAIRAIEINGKSIKPQGVLDTMEYCNFFGNEWAYTKKQAQQYANEQIEMLIAGYTAKIWHLKTGIKK